MRRTYAALLAAALTAGSGLASAGSAAAIGLDDSFGIGGISLTPTDPAAGSERYQALAAALDGGSYQSGFTNVAGGPDRAVIVSRLDANGVLVASFGPGGADGDGVVTLNLNAGPFANGPGLALPNGALENSRGLAVQADGKVVVAGQAETPQTLGKPDNRDRDIYVFRLNTDGTLDPTFNAGAVAPDVAGIMRVDLSNGIVPGTAAGAPLNTDTVYGVRIQPDGKIIVEGTKGTDTSEPTRTVRPWAILRIAPNGTLDTAGWNAAAVGGDAGVALSPTATNVAGTAPADLNERQPLIQPDGKVVAAGYTGGAAPYLARFNADGTLDTTFGDGGLTARSEALRAGFSVEAYDAVLSDGHYVMVGYGNRAPGAAAGDVDALIYRFDTAGRYDAAWGAPGSNGLTTFDQAGGQDRFRGLVALPDGRFVAIGLTSAVAVGAGDQVDGLMAVVKADGTFDTSVGTGGIFAIDLGGNADTLLGSAVVGNGTKVVAAGAQAFAPVAASAQDTPAVTRLDLTPLVAGAAADTAATPAPVPAPTATTAVAQAATVTVSCRRFGARKKRIRCTTKTSATTAKGTVRITLKRAGKIVATGKATVKKGAATVNLRGTSKAGRYSVVATFPTTTSKRQTLSKSLTIR
jgi:uncharacterized delta-60 repeat protein